MKYAYTLELFIEGHTPQIRHIDADNVTESDGVLLFTKQGFNGAEYPVALSQVGHNMSYLLTWEEIEYKKPALPVDGQPRC